MREGPIEDSSEAKSKSLQVISKLENGEFSQVWNGIGNSTTIGAVEIASDSALSTAEVFQEVESMTKLKHKHFLQVCRFFINMCNNCEKVAIQYRK